MSAIVLFYLINQGKPNIWHLGTNDEGYYPISLDVQTSNLYLDAVINGCGVVKR